MICPVSFSEQNIPSNKCLKKKAIFSVFFLLGRCCTLYYIRIHISRTDALRNQSDSNSKSVSMERGLFPLFILMEVPNDDMETSSRAKCKFQFGLGNVYSVFNEKLACFVC